MANAIPLPDSSVARSTPDAPGRRPCPATPEPPVRRWPHPVDVPRGHCAGPHAATTYRCALSYQNQLLADIKALLQQLAERES